MSIALMTEAWKADMPSGRKLVLLSLCDNANDQGECYPSVSMVAQRCSMGERTVQGHIGDLEADGVITRQERKGRSTVYRIDPRRIRTPAESAPPQNLRPTPADSAPTPPQNLRPTPADSAPRTVNEPSNEPSKESLKKRASAFVLPEWIDRELWDTWHTCEKRKKATDSQKHLAAKKLGQWRDEGIDWRQALENAAMAGWQGLYKPQQDKPGDRAQTTRQTETFRERDQRLAREKYAEWTGKVPARTVIDITPSVPFLEIEQ
jgi:DNA-binding transcriptional ArsR family regulator